MGLTILCISRISPAQITRNLVLEQAGYRVLATDDAAHAEKLFRDDLISAVIFGETMRADDRIELGTAFKQMKPSVPILFLYKMNGFRVPPGIADEQVEFLGGPKLLLQALNRLLGDGKNQRDDE